MVHSLRKHKNNWITSESHTKWINMTLIQVWMHIMDDGRGEEIVFWFKYDREDAWWFVWFDGTRFIRFTLRNRQHDASVNWIKHNHSRHWVLLALITQVTQKKQRIINLSITTSRMARSNAGSNASWEIKYRQKPERVHSDRGRCRNMMSRDTLQRSQKERSQRGLGEKIRGQSARVSSSYLVEWRGGVWERRLEQLGL